MSTAKFDNLSNRAGNGPPTAVGGRFCRAWLNYNGIVPKGVRGSFNISSVVDEGTGKDAANMATAMPNTNYSPVASFRNWAIAGSDYAYGMVASGVFPYTANTIRISSYATSGSNWFNLSHVSMAVFGAGA